MARAHILDQYGNNAAIVCPLCGGVFLISELLNKKSGRLCPHCGKARATYSQAKQLECHLIGDSNTRDRVRAILTSVKPLAAEFYKLTNKPLGVTGEVAEFVAAEVLNLELADARNVGFDARRGDERIQIKGRAYGATSKPGQRISRIKLGAPCDTVLLVLMDSATLEPREMWEAPYSAVCEVLSKPGSKARERGALGISAFKAIAKRVWPPREAYRSNVLATKSPSRRNQPTLHETMRRILLSQPNWTASCHVLCEENIRLDAYRQASGNGLHPPPEQFRLRAQKYPSLFELIAEDQIRFIGQPA